MGSVYSSDQTCLSDGASKRRTRLADAATDRSLGDETEAVGGLNGDCAVMSDGGRIIGIKNRGSENTDFTIKRPKIDPILSLFRSKLRENDE
jgi:hypothetical protein